MSSSLTIILTKVEIQGKGLRYRELGGFLICGVGRTPNAVSSHDVPDQESSSTLPVLCRHSRCALCPAAV